jgi:hypothetical protein
MDSVTNKFSLLKESRGAALITVVLMIVLITALLMMALNISGIEMTLSATNRRTVQGLHAAGGGVEMVPDIVKDVIDNGLGGFPPTVKPDDTKTYGDPTREDLLEEMDGVGGAFPPDHASDSPDLTITALSGQTIKIDIDYEGPKTLSGSELEEFAIAYHRKTGGTGCTTGTVYNIDAISSGVLSSETNVGAAYFAC